MTRDAGRPLRLQRFTEEAERDIERLLVVIAQNPEDKDQDLSTALLRQAE
jgi:hypothetical protein